MRPSRRRLLRFALALTLILLLALIFGHDFQKPARTAGPPPGPPEIPVVTAKAKIGDQPIYLTGLGSVTALRTVTLRTRVDGELMRIAVREGQMVHEGELIAEIDPRPFQVQLTQAEGQQERDQAILANAKIDLERYETLYREDSIAKQQLDTQAAAVRQDEAIVKSDQGAVDNAKLQLVYSRITSPITGRIGLRQIDPGNIVHAADQNGLAVITQLQPISVIFNIAQDQIPAVSRKINAGARLPVDAYDRDFRNKLATGYLLTIDNEVDVTTGTVRFKAVFANTDNALFPNQFVNAKLLLDVKRGAVLVPAAAIQRGPDKTFVFVVRDGKTVEIRPVVVGPIEQDTASIEKGLSAGEVVVTEGVDKLQQGSRVAERPADVGPSEDDGMNP